MRPGIILESFAARTVFSVEKNGWKMEWVSWLLQLAIEVRVVSGRLRLVIRSSTVADLPKTFCIYKQDTLIIKIRQLPCNIGRSLMSSPTSAAETKPWRALRRGNSGRVSTESKSSSI